ncbi:hypothetical protein ASD11_00525 [Aeromicrobium sp. Root495]|uniref:DUF952 domain-containing protein n=1 Tax=Aeromicrobium sp. Root495 TaxID=1736550 RepID=UPI0006F566C0|nr:DUF952 domain-containing protein [Aeromicrobium sp. Root495]KQY58191.1 hypothetical protein ASD11_00525 [Aeromicrobium sp. Root495]RYJ07554.1 MAG: DUF952 domain-containing protein [Actinomycetales bacterium]
MIHLVPLVDWSRDPSQPYAPASLAEEGFVHCAGDESVALAVANAFYRGAPRPLLALVIDADALRSDVVLEAAHPAPPEGVSTDVLFPHVFGPVDRDAVTSVLRVVWDEDDRAVSLEPHEA